MKKKEIAPFLELKDFDEIQVEFNEESYRLLGEGPYGLKIDLEISQQNPSLLQEPIIFAVNYKKLVNALLSSYAVNEIILIPEKNALIRTASGKKKQEKVSIPAYHPSKLLNFEKKENHDSLWTLTKSEIETLKSLEVSSAVKSIEQFAGITFSLKYPPLFLTSSSLALQTALPSAWSAYEGPAIESDIEKERILPFAYAKAINALPNDTVLRFYPDYIVADYQCENIRFQGQYPIKKAEYNIYSDILSTLCQNYESFHYGWFSTENKDAESILKELEHFKRSHKDEERTDLLVYLEPNQTIRFFSLPTKEVKESAWKWEVKESHNIDNPKPISMHISIYDFSKFLKGAEEGKNKKKSKNSKKEGQLFRLKIYQNLTMLEAQNRRGVVIAR